MEVIPTNESELERSFNQVIDGILVLLQPPLRQSKERIFRSFQDAILSDPENDESKRKIKLAELTKCRFELTDALFEDSRIFFTASAIPARGGYALASVSFSIVKDGTLDIE